MKHTEHKTTFADVLAFLELNGPQYAEDIGAHFWPDKIGFGSPNGGPSSVAVAASWMLGRMRVSELVEKQWQKWSGPAPWEITNKGREYLRQTKTIGRRGAAEEGGTNA